LLKSSNTRNNNQIAQIGQFCQSLTRFIFYSSNTLLRRLKVIERYASSKGGTKTIQCECGARISLIPQLDVMGKAIEAHAEVHMKKEPDPVKAEAEAKRIQDELIKQVLEKAGSY
jgi:hypothetical protein